MIFFEIGKQETLVEHSGKSWDDHGEKWYID